MRDAADWLNRMGTLLTLILTLLGAAILGAFGLFWALRKNESGRLAIVGFVAVVGTWIGIAAVYVAVADLSDDLNELNLAAEETGRNFYILVERVALKSDIESIVFNLIRELHSDEDERINGFEEKLDNRSVPSAPARGAFVLPFHAPVAEVEDSGYIEGAEGFRLPRRLEHIVVGLHAVTGGKVVAFGPDISGEFNSDGSPRLELELENESGDRIYYGYIARWSYRLRKAIERNEALGLEMALAENIGTIESGSPSWVRLGYKRKGSDKMTSLRPHLPALATEQDSRGAAEPQ